MKTNDLLAEIKNIALEDEAVLNGIVDSTYERLAEGSLSEDERAFLESTAQEDNLSSLAFEAFSPLGEDFEEGVTDEIVGYLSVDEASAEVATPAQKKESWVERLSQIFSVRILVPALSFCAVAALILPTGVNDNALPLYTFEMVSSDQVLRSGSGQGTQHVSQFSVGSLLDVIVRPKQPTNADVEVKTYLIESMTAREVNLGSKRSTSGAFRIKATIGEQFAKQSGLYELLVIVAPKGEFPSVEELRTVVRSGEPDASSVWQVFREPFQLTVGGAADAE